MWLSSSGTFTLIEFIPYSLWVGLGRSYTHSYQLVFTPYFTESRDGSEWARWSPACVSLFSSRCLIETTEGKCGDLSGGLVTSRRLLRCAAEEISPPCREIERDRKQGDDSSHFLWEIISVHSCAEHKKQTQRRWLWAAIRMISWAMHQADASITVYHSKFSLTANREARCCPPVQQFGQHSGSLAVLADHRCFMRLF